MKVLLSGNSLEPARTDCFLHSTEHRIHLLRYIDNDGKKEKERWK